MRGSVQIEKIEGLFAIVFFCAIIITLQLNIPFLTLGFLCLSAILFILSNIRSRRVIFTFTIFGLGFWLYLFLMELIGLTELERDIRIILGRLSLLVPILFLFLVMLIYKYPILPMFQSPNWQESMALPFMPKSKQPQIRLFLAVAVCINVLVFLPFLLPKDSNWYQEIWFFALSFALLNATFEELIWRGGLLTIFTEQFGVKPALWLTSLGFGLQHYSLGFSWWVCLFFAVGGLFYALITLSSKSIWPAILWHFVLNVLMVSSGLLF